MTQIKWNFVTFSVVLFLSLPSSRMLELNKPLSISPSSVALAPTGQTDVQLSEIRKNVVWSAGGCRWREFSGGND